LKRFDRKEGEIESGIGTMNKNGTVLKTKEDTAACLTPQLALMTSYNSADYDGTDLDGFSVARHSASD